MISTVTHILPLAKIRRSRFLPVAGTVLVRAGQVVEATDVVATANLNPEHILVDVARGLGVSRANASKFIKRQLGEEVNQESTIADKGGFGRVVRAPVNGKIVAINNGQILLEVRNQPFELLAGISGTVVEIEADYGVIIETTGAWVQGVWGNGQMDIGGLHVLAQEPDHELTLKEMDPSVRGVVLAGHCKDRNVLEAAVSNHWHGLILASMPTHLIPVAKQMPYPIVVLEGFGRIPMNTVTHTLLSTSGEREVTLNAQAYDPDTGTRPELIMPTEASGSPPLPIDLQRLAQGLKVRLLRAPYISMTGTISYMLPGLSRFESGLRAQGAEVELDNGEKVVVPLANIEVLG